MLLGLVNAHTGKVEETWNNIQNAEIKAIVGNDKVGKEFRKIDVFQQGVWCAHVDQEKRIVVSIAVI